MAAVKYRYQTIEFGNHDIHYRCLRDKQQFSDDDGEAETLGISSASWPLFGMVWQSGEVLAELMTDYNVNSRRILEIGCGVGLASLVLNERFADISATDIHPSAGEYLEHNTQLNNGKHIPFFRTAWEDTLDSEMEKFDLIIGSDLLYERQHSEALSLFIQHFAKSKCEVIIVEAGRGYRANFTKRMEELGFHFEQLRAISPRTKPDAFKGRILQFCRNM
jgi:ETFB lysine methyltransferase